MILKRLESSDHGTIGFYPQAIFPAPQWSHHGMTTCPIALVFHQVNIIAFGIVHHDTNGSFSLVMLKAGHIFSFIRAMLVGIERKSADGKRANIFDRADDLKVRQVKLSSEKL